MSDKLQLTVGLEIHIELETTTKMFCRCLNDPFHSEPNTNVCPVCYGLPGSLPVLNREAIEMTLKLGQALSGKLPKTTFWARKNYFYPDLPKGYQISQSSAPLVQEATAIIDGQAHRIIRIHLEEDAGKLTHRADGRTLVDYNRAGVPLIEIVTAPDFHTAESAKRFCQELQRIARFLKISAADMEKGQMRCEANISVAELGKIGTKVEVKNINSFRFVERAINYEFTRQSNLIAQGRAITQETRTWSESRGATVSMRVKETSEDYRYFPEPDLPVLDLSDFELPSVRLPEVLRQELIALGLSLELSSKLVDRGLYDWLLATSQGDKQLLGVAASLVDKIPLLAEIPQKTARQLITTEKIERGIADVDIAQMVTAIYNGESYHNLSQPSADEAQIARAIVDQFPELVKSYRSGKAAVLGRLLGEGRKRADGRLNMTTLKNELEKLLSS